MYIPVCPRGGRRVSFCFGKVLLDTGTQYGKIFFLSAKPEAGARAVQQQIANCARS